MLLETFPAAFSFQSQVENFITKKVMPRKNNALLNVILDFCFLCAIVFSLSMTNRISSVGRLKNVSIYDILLRRDVDFCIPWQNMFLSATLQQSLSVSI